MENRLVNYSVENGIAIIELNDPPANTYTYEMMRDLDDAILEARLDEDVHVIVIRGAGDKFFCAGANIKMLFSGDAAVPLLLQPSRQRDADADGEHAKLVIAAINGHAVGGGLEIALACDIRIAKKGPGMLGLPEINLGLFPGMGGTQRLPRIVGKGKALEMLTTGRTISVEEALPDRTGESCLRRRELLRESYRVRAAVCRARKSEQGSRADQARRSRRASSCRRPKRSRSNASCCSNSSRARMLKKGLKLTRKSARPNLREGTGDR